MWCNGEHTGLRNGSKRIRTVIILLRSLLDKYLWGRYEFPNPPTYGLNSATTVLLEGWVWH